jgi:O-antigen/teichoic acid export membrane protein
VSSSSDQERGFVASAAMLTIAQYVGAGVGFVTTLVAARLLGAKSFGIAAVVMAYPSVVSSFASVKTSAVTQRYVSGFRAMSQHRELLAVCKLGFVIDFAAMALAAAIISAAVALFGDLPGTNGHGDLVVLFALSLPFASLAGTGFVVMSAFRRFGLIAVLQVAQKVAILVTISAALALGGGTTAFVLINAAWLAGTGLVWLLIASAILSRSVGEAWWTSSWAPLRGLRGELRSLFSWNFVAVSLSGAVIQVPVLLLGGLRSPTDAAYFRLASAVSVTADSLEAAMNRVAYPMLAANQAVRDARSIARLVVGWSKREARLAVLAVVLAMAALPVLVLVLGDEYSGMLLGAELMLVGTATSAAFFFINPYLYSSGQVRKWVVSYGIYAVVVLGAGWLLADTGGFLALAALVGGGLAALNLALGLPILRRARRLIATPPSLGETTGVSGGAATRAGRL